MLRLLRSDTLQLDSRMLKYIEALTTHSIDYRVLYWERGQAAKTNPFCDIYEGETRPSQKWRKLFQFFHWNLFIFNSLFHQRKSFEIIHAVDLDTAVPGFLFSLIFRKKFIFDSYDCFADSRMVQGPLGSILKILERFIACHSNLIILPDDCRIKQLGLGGVLQKIFIVENVPKVSKKMKRTHLIGEGRIKIGFLGNLEAKHRGLEDLACIVQDSPNFEFHVVGYGALADYFQELAKKPLSRIFFYGPKPHAEGLAIMADMDIYCGLYYRTNPNHEFAAPNKYYEHLFLGRALLSTDGTPPGMKARHWKTGWAIQEGQASIRAWLQSIQREDVLIMGENATELWDKNYRNYYEDVIEGAYLAKLNGLRKISS